MRLIRLLGLGVLLAAAALMAVAVAARYRDGPLGPFPGGALHAGELVTDRDVDWSFAAPVHEIELGLVEPPSSRTTWVIVHEGQLYVPCGVPNFRLWKRWPHQALRDGRAVVRIDGKRYERQLVRVTDPELLAALKVQTAEKYGLGGDPARGEVWFFRLDPRP